jgi:hypothetical protein
MEEDHDDDDDDDDDELMNYYAQLPTKIILSKYFVLFK